VLRDAGGLPLGLFEPFGDWHEQILVLCCAAVGAFVQSSLQQLQQTISQLSLPLLALNKFN
jgi:hypothetical protein